MNDNMQTSDTHERIEYSSAFPGMAAMSLIYQSLSAFYWAEKHFQKVQEVASRAI